MSQSDNPQVDEVKRLLGRIQRLGQQDDLAEPDPRHEQWPGGHQWAIPMPEPRQDLADPFPTDLPYTLPAIAREERYAARDGRMHVRPRLRVPAIVAICASAAALGIVLTVTIRNQQSASPRLAESPPGVVMMVLPKPPSAPPVTHETKADVANPPLGQSRPDVAMMPKPPSAPPATHETKEDFASASVTSTPRLMVPAEWSAPAGVATSLPLAVEPYEEASKHQVFVSGLEASAFIIKGTEILEGIWMVPGDDLANATVVRGANAPGRTIVTLELKTETGEVLSRAQVILLAHTRSK